MKNVVFMPNIDLGNGRADAYHYSVKSWKYWCDKNNAEFLEWTEPLMDVGASTSGMDGYNRFPIIYQREWVFDILESNDIDYDQVLIIDADTIVHPDCPNVFEKTNHEYSVVACNGDYEWVTRSIDGWGKYAFPDYEKPKVWEYFNTGFIIANKKHKPFFKELQNFYLENIDELYKIRNHQNYKSYPIPGVGQTCVNFLVKKHKIKVRYLPERYNLQDIFRKHLLYIPDFSWWKDELLFLDVGWIYHFNAIPATVVGNRKNTRTASYWMKRTYEELYG